jgi:hypothetical protein
MKNASTNGANARRSRLKIKLGTPDLEHSKNAVLRIRGADTRIARRPDLPSKSYLLRSSISSCPSSAVVLT